MPEPNQPRRPDAIRCPRDYPRDPKGDRDVARNRIFGPVLGSKHVYNRERTDHPNESFVIAWKGAKHNHGADTLYYPKGHPNAGEYRHEWWIAERQKDGSFVPIAPEVGHPGEDGRVKVGYLLPDEFADDEQTQAEIQASYEERLREYRNSPEHIERLKALGVEPATMPGSDDVPSPAAPSPAILPNIAPASRPVPEPEK